MDQQQRSLCRLLWQRRAHVAAGGQVSSANGYLGTSSHHTGTVTVTGAGSKWTNAYDLYVGQNGSGTLTVTDGGAVSTRTLFASLSDLAGNGIITAKSTVLDADLVFDSTHGLQATVPFGTGGTINVTLDGTGALGAGYQGTGSLRVAGGITVASSGGFIGYKSGSTGTTTVTGASSTWTNKSSLYVGYSGSGMLTIEAGGQVSNINGYLGYNSGSTGTATVTGRRLDVDQCGKLSSTSVTARQWHSQYRGGRAGQQLYGYLGYNSGSTGTSTVTGASSKWINNGGLFVGRSGSGTLTIEAGGQVSSDYGYLGYNSDSTGIATVTGASSKWINNGFLYVGNSGSGTLTIEAGGQVSSSAGNLGFNFGSTGTAIVTGAGSMWTNNGTLNVGFLGSGHSLSRRAGRSTTPRVIWAAIQVPWPPSPGQAQNGPTAENSTLVSRVAAL